MKSLILLLSVTLLTAIASAASDSMATYDLVWSGAPFGNGASAVGQVTIDVTALPNPGGPVFDIYDDIAELTVTVTGARAGNGTWKEADLVLSDFGSYTNWDTGGGALNLSLDLVGQPTFYGQSWGTPDGQSGDFNLFFGRGGPYGTYFFTMTTNGGYGDQMLLTEFAPARAVPEPGTVVLLSCGIIAFTRHSCRSGW